MSNKAAATTTIVACRIFKEIMIPMQLMLYFKKQEKGDNRTKIELLEQIHVLALVRFVPKGRSCIMY